MDGYFNIRPKYEENAMKNEKLHRLKINSTWQSDSYVLLPHPPYHVATSSPHGKV